MDYGFLLIKEEKQTSRLYYHHDIIGANAFKQVDLGFNNQSHASDLKQAVQHGLTPEFRNRLMQLSHSISLILRSYQSC